MIPFCSVLTVYNLVQIRSQHTLHSCPPVAEVMVFLPHTLTIYYQVTQPYWSVMLANVPAHTRLCNGCLTWRHTLTHTYTYLHLFITLLIHPFTLFTHPCRSSPLFLTSNTCYYWCCVVLCCIPDFVWLILFSLCGCVTQLRHRVLRHVMRSCQAKDLFI